MQSSKYRLSFCIATFNRAAFIGAALEAIVAQATNECEILVSDNASTDNTEQVVSEYARRFDRLRYIRHDTNKGLDRNFDYAVNAALGEYCWLLSDDDLLKPGAAAAVLQAIRPSRSLIIVNVELVDFSMKFVERRWRKIESDRVYAAGEMDRLFYELDDLSLYIGNIVIRRDIWVQRNRERFYGSLFIHVGVIFQEALPGETLLIAEPLISYRLGNTHTFSSQITELLLAKWPSLVESLPLSEPARKKVRSAEPWRHPRWLFVMRGWGHYSVPAYKQWVGPRLHSLHGKFIAFIVALLPGILVNTALVLYYLVRQDRGLWLRAMRRSPYYLGNQRFFRRRP